ncbi:MAG: protein-L-isoaspartate(D-aspartate) O-methyltransferase [Betaproteobacteria bacterium]
MTSQRTRLRMVERLREEGIRDEVVLAAMGEVPRHIFVDEALATRAYDDIALPIGFGQTISAPLTVARMLELARAGRNAVPKALEIGTGCGYQAAVLSKLATEVYSVERISALLTKARRSLRELRVGNVKVKHADGTIGLKDYGPFDAIVMAAAAGAVPDALTEQLNLGGRLVIPIGTRDQRLVLVERTERGLTQSLLEEVNFVPLLPGLMR